MCVCVRQPYRREQVVVRSFCRDSFSALPVGAGDKILWDWSSVENNGSAFKAANKQQSFVCVAVIPLSCSERPVNVIFTFQASHSTNYNITSETECSVDTVVVS